MTASPDRPRRAYEPAETRRRILDATVTCLVEHGLAATTTLAVQRRAGVSRGALLHHFPSRAELVVAALLHLAAERARQLRADAAAIPPGVDRLDAVLRLLWSVSSGPLFHAALELLSAARTDTELHAVLAAREQELTTAIVRVCRQVFGPRISARPGFEVACEASLQLMRGMALTEILWPRPGLRDEVMALWSRLLRGVLTPTPSEDGQPDDQVPAAAALQPCPHPPTT
jgi:AcrR family transcriptional regulator